MLGMGYGYVRYGMGMLCIHVYGAHSAPSMSHEWLFRELLVRAHLVCPPLPCMPSHPPRVPTSALRAFTSSTASRCTQRGPVCNSSNVRIWPLLLTCLHLTLRLLKTRSLIDRVPHRTYTCVCACVFLHKCCSYSVQRVWS